ncbi:MAG: carbohydrate-binding family 9-like protein [Thermoanaerobaculia bacterium]
MPPPVPTLDVPLLSPTDRLVSLPPLRLSDARTGAAPRLSTAVRVGLRGQALCVRFDARDDGVVATHTERDAPLWTGDVCEVFLAPEEPARVYYELEVNPLGALFDARVESPELSRATMRVETAWDCRGLSGRVSRRPGRWSALLTIPLGSLCAGEPPPCWRANFYRIDRGARDEYSAWSPTFADPPDFHLPERFGILRMPSATSRSRWP